MSMAPYQIFISYAREDLQLKDRLVNELQTLVHLGLVKLWHDLKIGAGAAFEREIYSNIDRSDIFLPLISPHFMASSFCLQELERAKERIQAQKCNVLPILLSETPGWDKVPAGNSVLGSLQALPPGGEPLDKWMHQDQGWRAISRKIGEMAIEKSGASLNSHQVEVRILATIGTFVFDSIAEVFDNEGWNHYHSGDDPDAETGLYGNVEYQSTANKLTLSGYDDDFECVETVAAVLYEPQFHRFSYSIVEPRVDRGLLYRFDLVISMLEGVSVEAARMEPKAAEVDPELTLQDFLGFLKETFRAQMQRYRTDLPAPASNKKLSNKNSAKKKS
jgi:hypothetical protein